jgi:hypothetical protein
MGWVGAIDHVVGRFIVGGFIHSLNDCLHRLTCNKTTICFYCKGEKMTGIPTSWAALTILIPLLI